MNWIPYFAKYLSWIGLLILGLWALLYWFDIPSYDKIDKPMVIIGVAFNVIGNLLEQLNKKK